MQIFSKIDIGKVRTSNQDAYFAGELSHEAAFAVVCDGMGGANAGNVASETAVKCISDYVIHSYEDKMDTEAISKMLKNAIVDANIRIYDMALNNSVLSGMGTTVVAAVIRNGTAIISHVGDSRAYILNDDITQITRDHSVVQSLLESGKITPEDAKVHPRKNVITRALGVEEEIITDNCEIPLLEGDTLLLCTDGLTNFVEPADILNIYKNTGIVGIAEALVDLANANGGGDNITVVVVTK